MLGQKAARRCLPLVPTVRDPRMEIFIRHKIDNTSDVLQQLWEQNFIALHYEDILSTDPDAYQEKSAKDSMKRMKRFCEAGAYVGAVYGGKQLQGKILIGELPAKSRFFGKTFTDRADPAKGFSYKVAQLVRTRTLSLIDFPVLASIQPRQGALSEWHSANGIIKALVTKTPMPFSVNSIHTGQLEVLCYEYLRHKGLLSNLLAPIGRTMIDLDILALDERGGRVIGQVTFSDDQEKLERLQTYSGCASVYFFSKRKSGNHGRITCIAIDDVFEEMRNSPAHKRMLEIMCGRGGSTN